MSLSANITKRVRKRRLTDGTRVKQTRWVLNYRDHDGKRRQLFFETQGDAQAKRDDLALQFAMGTARRASKLTVAEAVTGWLENRAPEVKRETIRNYKLVVNRHLTPHFGHFRVTELTTAQIRKWHQEIRTAVGAHTANAVKKYLRAALALAAEDHNIPVAAMPSRLGRGKPKPLKTILTPDEVAQVLRRARSDPRGLYYAFPFLTGVRPSEQLGLLWTDVDLESGVVRIRRMLERFGTLCDVTKTAAGMRDIPIGPTLRKLLTAWRERCPRRDAAFPFVFPAPQGGPYLYWNFRRREWKPGLLGSGVRYVTPHSARHAFISTLQAQGFEVGLVAKIAGHTPSVSLAYYTQAVRSGGEAVAALEQAFGA